MTLTETAAGIAIASIRPGAALFASPLFGNSHVPVPLRIAIAIAIGWAGFSAGNPQAALTAARDAPFIVLPELLIGLTMGFAMQMAFAAAMMAGEVIGNTMGLGFATSPNGLAGPAPTLGNFMSFATTAIFLASQGHLTLVAMVVASFHDIPIGSAWFPGNAMAMFGTALFSGAVSIALPVTFALVIVQVVLALIAKAAPALNLFAIGLPFTQLAGAMLLVIAFPAMGSAIGEQIRLSFELATK
ncbi:flagellar biosynthetic protein FliR [Sphingomonas sp.]|uniref:flagellar biosynthetic protein FliR n=1 Tax=Sphingomonas sp. TaxID=28214 RepID=UPI0025ED58D0|nr:flagellar biosynthetic protein FliR [Sphingomonas sp.]